MKTVSARRLQIFEAMAEIGGLLVPLAPWDEIHGDAQVFFLAFWIALLMPVPIAVVQLNDNSPQQAMTGAVSGVASALLWSILMRIIQHQFNHRLGARILGCQQFYLLSHNLSLPCFIAEQRCAEADAQPKEGVAMNFWRKLSFQATAPASSFAMPSSRPDRELAWYLEQTNRRRALCQCFPNNIALASVSFEQAYLQDRATRLEKLIKGTGYKDLQRGKTTTVSWGVSVQALQDNPPRPPSPRPASSDDTEIQMTASSTSVSKSEQTLPSSSMTPEHWHGTGAASLHPSDLSSSGPADLEVPFATERR
jgi:hypothetical protein